ncbi:NAD-dependent epimerase/dehydratase family protein [Helicobacter saguini]|uniref:GDP-L-fucose synthase n=1 Tax=Helicobacter saguini TaxID=1548018 RepID=A0A099B7G9_9HELI|nr:GDP-L-fucose synthase [Helicobacter saguini]MWV60966.1 NAD-dependent epimerase/dehydratase family protein [Helicobacter saguini]MWV68366.1 NAD-dependent epimerase/dehydratase family protein [Helicobacter saguini]MWV70170.1 NAD-dependent epimerase/dehydratase family protein [Helicobacter saguini]MWV72073.1 NAD-dependent epimerase/dehydratase family protein [Helicobacter saguini]TLD93774.1 GDP-L-fucose synthase [Helicobacter saguini]
MKKDSKIFVAGHNGLVGSSITNALKKQGFTNLILKNRSELDLLDSNAVRDFFAKEKPEFVFLAAAKVGGILANNTYRADFIFENLTIQNNVIFNAYKFQVKKLLFLGSSCIYPKNAPQPMRESCLLTSELEYTNEPYAIAKIAGIKMCESFNLQHGTNFISIMPTNLYGNNDNFNLKNSHVLPALIRKFHLAKLLANGDFASVERDLARDKLADSKDSMMQILNEFNISSESVGVWGSGRPRREFLHSDDMAEASVFIMQNVDFADLCNSSRAQSSRELDSHFVDEPKSSISLLESAQPANLTHDTRIANPTKTGNLKGEVRNTHINVGFGEDISIKELAELVREIVGFKGEIIFDKTKPDGTFQKLMDSSKLNKLGFTPRISLREGIKSVYENYLKL